MTEKAFIRDIMAQNLRLPTDLSAKEVLAQKHSAVHIRPPYFKIVFVTAALAAAASLGTVLMLLKGNDPVFDPKNLSAVSQPVQSSSDTTAQESRQLKSINNIASELAQSPEKFYACCCLSTRQEQSETQFCKSESMTTSKVSAAAKTLGEHLQSAQITYLGSDKAKDSTVSSNIKLIFEQYANVHFVNIYPRPNCDAAFSKLIYTVKDGVGYICAEQSGNDLLGTPRHYFSFTCESLPLFGGSDLRLADWETDETFKTITPPDGKQAPSITNDDNTAGLSFNVNNSGQMPVVNITDIKLPENEKVSDAKLEIYLCRKKDGSSVPVKAAALTGELKTGSFDFSLCTSYISKQDTDGIMIHAKFNTDIHPAPENNSNSQQSAYNLTLYYEVS